MKAKVRFKAEGQYRTKIIEVEKNEPNLIVREFVKQSRLPKHTYITCVKCGRYNYQWLGTAYDAFGI